MSFIDKVLSHLKTTREEGFSTNQKQLTPEVITSYSLRGFEYLDSPDECCGECKGQCPSESAMKHHLAQHNCQKASAQVIEFKSKE